MADQQQPEMGSLRERHVSDLVRVVLGVLILTVASLPVRPDTIGRVERGAFDLVNGLPDFLYPVLWLPMQLGSLMAVPVVAVAALALGRRRLALDAVAAGFAAWTLAKVVKDGFGRPRPGGLLDEVVFRGSEPIGLGFVSGHTAVAFSLATIALLHLPRRWRRRALALAAVVGLARMFVGAHLPLDIVGGAALGWAIAALIRWLIGAPTGRPEVERLRRGLAGAGLHPEAIVVLDRPARRSAVYRVEDANLGPLFVKVVSDGRQDRDLLHRWWLRLTAPDQARAPHVTHPHLAVMGEANAMGVAESAGARVPKVLWAGHLDGDLAALVTAWVDGRQPAGDDRAALADATEQMHLLHAARILHGDLRVENLLVDGRGAVHLVDFGDARLLAGPEVLATEAGQFTGQGAVEMGVNS